MNIAHVVALCLVILPRPSLAVDALEDPVILHAVGLAAELDGDSATALTHLRKAQGLAPADRVIAFDLARLAFESHSPTLAQDSAVFLSAEPETADAQLLRAYLHLAQGQRQQASVYVSQVESLRPNDGEVLKLKSMLGDTQVPEKASAPSPIAWFARIGSRTGYDSNVRILPADGDVEGQQTASPLIGADGLVRIGGGDKALGYAATVAFGWSKYLTDDVEVQKFNPFSTVGIVGLSHEGAGFNAGLKLQGVAVFLDDFGSQFMSQAGARADIRVPLEGMEVGAYAGAAQRNFGDADGDPLFRSTARSGLRYEGGMKWGMKHALGTLQIGAGGFKEDTEERLQNVTGAVARLGLRANLDPLWLTAAVDYQYRNYSNSKGADQRTDNRSTPQLKAAYTLSKHMRINASYRFTNNSSLAHLSYQRHVAQMGLEGMW